CARVSLDWLSQIYAFDFW
nr:immunoglobulin heavy chain junction region [Macaca mulatta]MOV36312.1 immunoglobulin heavy chain junction region [Macaca mulatta]